MKEITGLAAPFQITRQRELSRGESRFSAAKGAVSFSGDEIAASGLDNVQTRFHPDRKPSASAARAAKDAGKPVKPARIGLYRPWVASIDEGWTRWILEQYQFPFTSLYNADIRGGHLRERYDVIIIPDIERSARLSKATAPARFPNATPAASAKKACRNCAISLKRRRHAGRVQQRLDVRHQPVQASGENAHRGRRCRTSSSAPDACSRFTSKTRRTRSLPDMASDTIVMFERGPAFNTKTDFKGTVLARYPRERSPLESGYLAGADRIEGKIAALSADLGKGHVILLGFKPQWRGQSHAGYKFFFNSLYVQE